MASLSDTYGPLRAPDRVGSASMRSHSYSAVESYLSADSSISSSSVSSSSTSTIASSSSSTSTLTPPEPVSAGGGGGGGGVPLWKTLVRPRPWRFVQRSRVGGSLDRERAHQEDTALDGDRGAKDMDSDNSSCVDGDVFTGSEKTSSESSGRGGSRAHGVDGAADSVNRAQSESDIAARKPSTSGERRPLGFKTRAERFSLQDNKVSQPRPSAMTRSQTLPPSGRSSLAPASQPQTLPRGPTLVDSSRRSRSSNRVDGPKTVKFSEPEKVEFSPARSDSSSDKGSDKSDSPSKSVTLNVQNSSVKVSFSKPPVSAKPPAVSEKPDLSSRTKVLADRPHVPAKPARLNITSNGPSSVPVTSSPSSSSSLTAKSTPSPTSKTHTKDSAQPKSSGKKSPNSSYDDVLHSTGFTAVDEGERDSQSTPSLDNPHLRQEDKRRSISEEQPSDETPCSHPLENGVETSTDCSKHLLEDINDNIKDFSEAVKSSSDEQGRNEESETDAEVSSQQDSPASETNSGRSDESKKTSVKDIVPKKMIKIKGDKKAEEKAAKAKKKEQKEKEKKEKEVKSRKKTPSPDGSRRERSRIKLFPWKVEFSAKDKSSASDAASSAKDSKKKGKDGKKGKAADKETDPLPAGAKRGVHAKQNGGTGSEQTVPTKKTDKSDAGAGTSATTTTLTTTSSNNTSNNTNKTTTTNNNNNKSPHDKKDSLATKSHPLQLDDEDDGVLVEDTRQHPQQQHQHHPHHPQQQQPAPSPSPPHLHPPPIPHHQHHQQHHPHYQQQQQQPPPQPPPRLPTPKARYFDDVSSSDQNSDLDSWYGSLPRRTHQGRNVRIYESDGETVPLGPPHQEGGGRRKVAPRRHTVGGAQIQEHMQLVEDTDRKREAFYEMLASRYPQYADKITGLSAYHNPPVSIAVAERNSRPREPQRRRTTVPAFCPYNSRSLDYDDPGTMSDVELSSFQRGGYARASMPIVRSASTSLERPMGLVFLVFRDETKKALLPNEVTSLDTVRALFVRAFSEKLSMEYLDSPKRKIYILEASTSIFFQLEDLKDIKDRTVLKIHECDSEEPQYVRCPVEIRGRTTQPVRPLSHQGTTRDPGPHFRDEMVKAQSLPVSSAQTYQEMLQKERLQWEREQEYLQQQQRRSRSRSVTPEPAERPRSLSAGPARGRYSHSPDRLQTQERGPGPLNTIPENPRLLANGFRQAAAANGAHYDGPPHPALHGHPGHPGPHGGHPSAAPPPPARILSAPPVVYESAYPPGSYSHPQAFVSHSMRAPAPQGPLRATGPPPPDMRGNNRAGPPHRQSLPFAAMTNPVYDSFPQRSQSYRVTPERDVLPPRPQSASSSHEVGRMDRMEAQIASLAAWVHQSRASPPVEGPAPAARRNSSRSTSSGQSEGTDTYPASSASKPNGNSSYSTLPGLSDIPDACTTAQPMVTSEMRDKINDMHCRMQELRVELQGLRRMEQRNQEAMRDAFTDTFSKIKRVISAVPGAEDQVVRQQRQEVNSIVDAYRQDRARVEKELSDLESSVEELKQDVLARKCRVNMTDVEGLALVLSNITKSLADLKARYPKVNENLRKVMAGEMEIVVKEEKFIKEEPQQIESALKRCKKLTSTLYTLKRLATVQDTRPPQVPALALESREVGDDEKMAILESIRAMVPDHDTRVHNLEAADASRERKKKIVTQHESLMFTKSLQAASKSLKPPESHTTTTTTTTITEDGSYYSDPDSCRRSGGVGEHRRSEPPVVPAKPARLMLITEPLHSDGASSSPSPSPILPVAHTVVVTSQIACEKQDAESKAGARGSSSRSAFFSAMESPPSVVPQDRSTASVEVSPTVTVSAAVVSPGPSQVMPLSSIPCQSLRRPSSASDSPHQAEDKDDLADRERKVPPPPPPRRSSARYPYGIGPLSPQSPPPHTESGGGSGLQRQHSGEQSPDRSKQAAAAVMITTVYKAHSPSSTTTTGPLSSTPKPPTPQKPANLSRLLKAGPGGSMKQRPQLQHQRVGPDGMFTTFIPPVPAAVVTNNQDLLDDADLSESESTGSTTSLDSQQGATLVRTNSTPHRGPKPHPPQRCSSLSMKEEGEGRREEGKAQTHVLEVRKPLRVGSMTVQVNGLDGVENGHKT